MTLAPIGLQSHTIRHLLRTDTRQVLQQVAALGYLGLETGLGNNASAAEQAIHLGLQVPSVMTGLPISEAQRPALDQVAALGCRYISIPWQPAEEFQRQETIQAIADRLNTANTIVQQHGLTLTYHNHWWEFEPIFDGKTPHEVLIEQLDTSIAFEVDVYWAQVGGSDPVEVVKRLGIRAPLLHIKDGPAVKDAPMTAVGGGIVDIPAIIQAGEPYTQWLFVELDECATDIMEAVAQSYRYLVERSLGRGKQS